MCWRTLLPVFGWLFLQENQRTFLTKTSLESWLLSLMFVSAVFANLQGLTCGSCFEVSLVHTWTNACLTQRSWAAFRKNNAVVIRRVDETGAFGCASSLPSILFWQSRQSLVVWRIVSHLRPKGACIRWRISYQRIPENESEKREGETNWNGDGIRLYFRVLLAFLRFLRESSM